MRRHTLLVSALCIASLASANLTAPVLTAQEAKKQAATYITPAVMKDYLTFIASDALQGRDTPSQGLDVAAEFIAFHLKRFGAKPGGDAGTYFQNIPLSKTVYDAGNSSMVMGTTRVAGAELNARGATQVVKGSVVLVTDTLDGIDVKGKIVLAASSSRNSVDQAALRAGALAVVRDTGYDGENWTSFMNGSRRFGGGYQPGKPSTEAPAPPRVSTSKRAFAALQAEAASTPSGELQINLTSKIDVVNTRNVIAIIEGSDPKLKSEYVAVGAHYDHVGIDTTKTGDQIYNGADDDGSGTVALMGMAEAAARSARPKRSLIFVWHAGEEKGLWGSEYFANNPTVPVKDIVAQLNIDMIGRSRANGDTNPRNKDLTGPNEVYVIGTTMMSTRLGKIVHETNSSFLKLGYDSKYDAPNDPNQFFYRSDHYNYAKVGIPVCFWFSGVHEDYHQLGDEVAKIDFNKLANITKTVFLTAINVANEPTRPPVDKPLDMRRR